MGHKVKWIEDNLGITRKALRILEHKELISHNTGTVREYSEEDIDQIWLIKVFQGMGYSLDEIKRFDNEEFDFADSLEKKVFELEKRKEKIDSLLGYAKYIKMTGRFPCRPESMGGVKIDEFNKNAIENWTINNDPIDKMTSKLLDTALSEGSINEEHMNGFIDSIYSVLRTKDTNDILTQIVIPREIVKRIDKGPHDVEVQLLVKILLESIINSLDDTQGKPFGLFLKTVISSFVAGDLAKLRRKELGQNGCEFIANSIAVMGGWKCYEDAIL